MTGLESPAMLLFETTPKPVIIHDGVVIFHANPAALRLFRYPSVEAMQRVGIAAIIADKSRDLSDDRVTTLRSRPYQNLPDARLLMVRADRSCFWATVKTYSGHWMLEALQGHEAVVDIVFFSSAENVVDDNCG